MHQLYSQFTQPYSYNVVTFAYGTKFYQESQCHVIHVYQFVWDLISSAENQKGINAVQWCSVDDQKGAIAIDFV